MIRPQVPSENAVSDGGKVNDDNEHTLYTLARAIRRDSNRIKSMTCTRLPSSAQL